ncbi:malto-oligosyltrehalose trehalohydrolase [Aggregicoccus sp. 17bor-14]|nr:MULTISPECIES: malto-oligosyltrehalose trehalohydrolase [Myxococcaceae]MBF5041103.1 malto-oligosyltrehalose trehalohydrolase [Simulacricoccus sp. 17bor-14]MRI86890.1 malto-oligosyltrehalose trehalohydrolase [Aggregicoccus sp. 17bor-14]
MGARPSLEGRTRFRVWAPRRERVEVCLAGAPGASAAVCLPLQRASGGYFEGELPVPTGALYTYRLDGGACFPDPASRFQPQGPHGPSQVVDPRRHAWGDAAWRGPELRGQVLYELHVGTFTREGTYAAAAHRLPQLAELGVTCLELMPLHTFPGRFNWGYDGVTLFAPCAVYGSPDDLRRFVDRAHALGLSVLLDVVYNHLGPDGNYLAQYSPGYFSTRYPGEWGDPTNFDAYPDAEGSREFFIQNACHWVSEYHFDGLRLDATQSLFDQSARHVVQELTARVREAAGPRRVLVVSENEPQDVRCVQAPEQGGHGTDALWIDDFHHTARVAALGRREAYLVDYTGTAQELLSCALRNALYQGQHYRWQQKPRGTPLLHTPAPHAVFFLQNHDQLANTLRGERLCQLAGPARARALTLLLLLLPQTPLLFMGQEWAASTPFLYFVDHKEELQPLVERGRNAFVSQFPAAREALEHEGFRIPFGEEAFRRSQLDWSECEREPHRGMRELHRKLLRLRREDPVFAAQARERLAGAVLSRDALVLRYLGDGQQGDRLLLLNLGTELDLSPCPEPLLAPEAGKLWRPLLSSEETRFGGSGMAPLEDGGRWRLPGQTACVLISEERTA